MLFSPFSFRNMRITPTLAFVAAFLTFSVGEVLASPQVVLTPLLPASILELVVLPVNTTSTDMTRQVFSLGSPLLSRTRVITRRCTSL